MERTVILEGIPVPVPNWLKEAYFRSHDPYVWFGWPEMRWLQYNPNVDGYQSISEGAD